MLKYAKLFYFCLIFLYYSQYVHAIRIIQNNPDCPQGERYRDRIEYNQVYDKKNGYWISLPRELIEKADDKTLVAVPRKELELLKKAKSSLGKTKNKFFDEKYAYIGLDPRIKPFFNMYVITTPKKILQAVQCVSAKDGVGESNPPSYTFIIKGKSKSFGSNITDVLYQYEHFERLLREGWIRCSGKEKAQLYYDCRYFKPRRNDLSYNDSPYYGRYGLRFREILCPNDTPEGALFELYDFAKDPESKQEPMKTLIAKFRNKIANRRAEENADKLKMNMNR